MTIPSQTILDIVTQAALRFSLKLAGDGTWRGQCPVCRYPNHTLGMKAQGDAIALSCCACGRRSDIAGTMGLPTELVGAFKSNPFNAVRAIEDWGGAAPASGTMAEAYLRARGIAGAVPSSIRFIERKWNWRERKTYPAMISLVAAIPREEGSGASQPGTGPIASGAHYTFLTMDQADGSVRKAETEASKLTLGRIRGGGVWLTPFEEIGGELAVAEGIETALSVMQLTGLPTVAALSGNGMRSLHWPPQVHTLWIAADNDPVGLKAASCLHGRAVRRGLCAHIKVPGNGNNDFNDLLRSAS